MFSFKEWKELKLNENEIPPTVLDPPSLKESCLIRKTTIIQYTTYEIGLKITHVIKFMPNMNITRH